MTSVRNYQAALRCRRPAGLSRAGAPESCQLPPGHPNPYASTVADDYIIGAGGLSRQRSLAREGGELIPGDGVRAGRQSGRPRQRPRDTADHREVDCQFPDYPGTVSWKRGFSSTRKPCSMRTGRTPSDSGSTPTRRPRRSHCCRVTGPMGPAGFNEDGNCESGVPNPLIHVPAGVSGTAELPRWRGLSGHARTLGQHQLRRQRLRRRVDDDARARTHLRPRARRRRAAQLQAELSQRDELHVPAGRADRRRWRPASGLLRTPTTTMSTKTTA